MSIQDFKAKWRESGLKERAGAQEHCVDLCRALGQPTPARETYILIELAVKLGVSRTIAYELARTDDLPVRAIRVGRRYLLPKAQVDSLLTGEVN